MYFRFQPMPNGVDIDDLPCGLYVTGERKTEDYYDGPMDQWLPNQLLAKLVRIDTVTDLDGKSRPLPDGMEQAYYRHDGCRVVVGWVLEKIIKRAA